MSFRPVVPLPGYAGWRFLDRTAGRQQALHAETPALRRDADAFRDRIGKVTSAQDLISDRGLLRVALGAFGLESDLDSKAFVRKVLESAPGDPKALANRLADKRYQTFARAFGFATPGGPFTADPGFADRIVAAYRTRSFEAAVGESDGAMRLALSARRELAELAVAPTGADTRWLTVMGQPPLRKVFETALGLPPSFGSLDLDRQIEVFRNKSERAFGSAEIAQFADPARREDLVRLFLLRSEAAAVGAAAPSTAALTLLQARRS